MEPQANQGPRADDGALMQCPVFSWVALIVTIGKGTF